MSQLQRAEQAFSVREFETAISLAWEAVRPAVIAQNDAVIGATAELALAIAAQADADVQREAQQLADYCMACIRVPRDAQPSPWSFTRMLNPRPNDN